MVLVVRILKRYGAAYPTLIPRTMRTLLHALLDPSKVTPLRPLALVSFARFGSCFICVGTRHCTPSLPVACLSPPLQPFCTHFGALSAISTMSPHSTATLLLPHMLPYAAHAPSQTLAPVANNPKPVANV